MAPLAGEQPSVALSYRSTPGHVTSDQPPNARSFLVLAGFECQGLPSAITIA